MNLIETLQIEKELMTELLETLKAEKEALIKDNAAELETIIKCKEALKSQIEEVENSRLEVLGHSKLREIIPSLEIKDRLEAEKLKGDMEDLVFQIQLTNDTNGTLAMQALNYSRLIINALSPKKVSTYSPYGRVQNNHPASSMLNKSV